MMEFIGDARRHGRARLAQLAAGPRRAGRPVAAAGRRAVGAGPAGLAHGDLSPYNLLVHDGRLVLIDLPQVVDVVANPQGRSSSPATCATWPRWFRPRGLDLTDDDVEALTARLLEETGMR